MKTITHTDDSLNFTYYAQRNPGWHSHKTDKRTLRALRRAAELGALELHPALGFRYSR